MLSAEKRLKLYEKAYKKCIRSCKMKKKKSCCKSPFLKMNLDFSKKSKSKSKSKRKLNAYQKFVKKEYPKLKEKGLDRQDIFKAIAKEWKKKM